MTQPKALIITIGDEILIGQITDTNSQWIAQNLFKEGFRVEKMISLKDFRSEIIETLNSSTNKYDLIVITGGLGPTNDDITKLTLTEYFESSLILNQEVLDDIKEMVYRRTGSTTINQRNHDQALVPENCTVLRNKVGTAPGMVFKTKKNKALTISLPGVPHEMKWLFDQHLISILHRDFKLKAQRYELFTIMGLSESALAHILETWENALPLEWKPAYLPAAGVIRLRMLKPTDRNREFDVAIQNLKDILKSSIVAINEESIQTTIAKILINNNLTISTAESCTGGNIAKTITEIPGASAYFRGSIIAYSNEIKMNLLHVSEQTLTVNGAVSKETVEQMATGGAKVLQSDICIATSGIAGPDGGTISKPVGTIWIAIHIKGKIISKKHTFGSIRNINIERTTNESMLLLLNILHDLYK